MTEATALSADAATPHVGLLRLADRAAEAILVVALLGELGVVIVNVLGRTFLDTGYLWTDEIARLALSAMTFVGGALAYRRGHHAFVRSLIDRLPDGGRRCCLALSEMLVLVGAGTAFVASLGFIATSWDELTPILQMPAAVMVIPLTASMFLVGVYALERLWRVHRAMALRIGGPVAVLFALAVAGSAAWMPWLEGDGCIYAALLLFLVSVLIGLPVGFALLLASACYLWIADAVPMIALPQNMVNGTGNFVLLAIPFFVFAGLIMERGGISLRLVQFVHSLVGHVRGGLFQVMVVSMYLVSGLSGSKSADVAAVGSVMRRHAAAREDRHGGGHGGAGGLGPRWGETVPPSIAMLILGSITNLSIAALFIAGLIPAAVIALCLAVLIYARARRGGVAQRRAGMGVVARAGMAAILPLGMPVLLFAGILLGLATPTEISAFAVVYGLVLSVVLYRAMDARGFLGTVIDSATLTGMILFILAAASSFSWVLTVADLPQRLVEVLRGVNDSTPIFMIGSILLLIVSGSLLEGLPALNVLAPLLLPIARAYRSERAALRHRADHRDGRGRLHAAGGGWVLCVLRGDAHADRGGVACHAAVSGCIDHRAADRELLSLGSRCRCRTRSVFTARSGFYVDDQGRAHRLGAQERLARSRRPPEPVETQPPDRGDRAPGAEDDGGERGGKEARGEVGEGVGRELWGCGAGPGYRYAAGVGVG